MLHRNNSTIRQISKVTGSKVKSSAGRYTHQSKFRHAVVIGSSVTGLTAARVLASYFDRVTVIERDHPSEGAEYRNGLFQAYHAHSLHPRGQALLEGLFPGLVNELLEKGAVPADPQREIAFYSEKAWRQPRGNAEQLSIYASRPLMDSILYRRLAAMGKVDFLYEREATGLITDKTGRFVTGIRIRNRRSPFAGEEHIAANLVVDASGRNSKAPQWLRSLGFEAPQDTIVDAFAGYASRIYRRPETHNASWKTLYIRPTAPDDTRGGIIIPLEGDRWHVTLFGMGKDYPPHDETNFLQFARSLPTGRLYEAIKDAEPVSKIHAYRRTESRRRHYESLPAYLEGFLVYGDAAYTLNPVYAMGMTAAVLGSEALDQSLRAHTNQGYSDLNGLAKDFQTRLSRALERPWKTVTSQDQRWSTTETREGNPLAGEPVREARQPSLALQPA